MSSFKELLPQNIKTARSSLSQLIDVLQEDISSSISRRRYQHFVTGTTASPGVTSSLFQTVYDVDFTLQSSNAIMDMTVGLFPDGDTVASSQTGTDSAGKELFPSSSLMMREKMDIYRQFAQTCLGDNTLPFTAPLDSSDSADEIDVACFLSFKRLFARDSIKRETYAMRMFKSASINGPNPSTPREGFLSPPNLRTVSNSGSIVITDIGAATNKLTTFGGQVGNLVDSSNTSTTVGLLFYDLGICVIDVEKVSSGSQFVSGTIDGVTSTGNLTLGKVGTETAFKSKYIPDFFVSASIDNIVDHMASVRFGSGSNTAITFQNVTNINSTLIFCRLEADEANYSSNPTFVDEDGRIRTIEVGQEDSQTSFTFITKIGLYDAADTLLAVASLSRPAQKSNERDLTIRVRLDF